MTDQKPTTPPLDLEKWKLEQGREEAHRAHDRMSDYFEHVNESSIKVADGVLKACLLINGGAAVSVLAFIGGLVSKELISVSQLAPVADSLVLFALGVVAAVAGMGLSYFVHYASGTHVNSMQKIWVYPWVIPGKYTSCLAFLKATLHLVAVIVATGSITLFALGIYSVRNSIDHLPANTAAVHSVP
jgi:hypothetical protein